MTKNIKYIIIINEIVLKEKTERKLLLQHTINHYFLTSIVFAY